MDETKFIRSQFETLLWIAKHGEIEMFEKIRAILIQNQQRHLEMAGDCEKLIEFADAVRKAMSLIHPSIDKAVRESPPAWTGK